MKGNAMRGLKRVEEDLAQGGNHETDVTYVVVVIKTLSYIEELKWIEVGATLEG